MKIKNTVVAGALSLMLGSANADFLDYGGYSTDTITGLNWLDVTATAGLSYNQVLSGVGGWQGLGWRYATGNEVRNLFATYVGTGPEYFVDGNYPVAQSLVRQMGVSVSFNNDEGIRSIYCCGVNQISIDGWFNDGTLNNIVGIAELIARQPGTSSQTGSRWVVYEDFGLVTPDQTYDGYGSYLVRSTVSTIAAPIPEPETYAMMLAGLGLLGVVARRRKPQG